MIGDIGYWLSFFTGLVLLGYSSYAVYIFSRVWTMATTKESKSLSLGIILIAFSLGANTLYWQVFGQLALAYTDMTVATLRLIGFYMDVLLKGSGIIGLIYTSKGVLRYLK